MGMSHYACRVCRSSHREEIEQLLSQKLPFRDIAKRFVNTFNINLHALEQSVNCHRKHFKELSKQEKELLDGYKKGEVTNDEVERIIAARAFENMLMDPQRLRFKDFISIQRLIARKENLNKNLIRYGW